MICLITIIYSPHEKIRSNKNDPPTSDMFLILNRPESIQMIVDAFYKHFIDFVFTCTFYHRSNLFVKCMVTYATITLIDFARRTLNYNGLIL